MLREEVSHVLRTPLTTVKGVLHLLATDRLRHVTIDEQAEMIHGAWRQALVLEEVVGRIESLFHSGPDTEEATVIAVEGDTETR